MRSTQRLGKALEYAEAHHDLLPTWVLAEEGLSPTQIRLLVSDGILERIIRGLFRMAGTRTPLQDIAAAVTRHGSAVASHTSALFVHGLDLVPPAKPHITLPPGSTSGTSLGVLHRSPLDPIDRSHRQRVPVTALPRSIVDSAELLSIEELAAVVNEAISRKLVRIPHIVGAAERVEAAPGRVGSGRLRAVLATWTDVIEPDSPAEAAAIRRIRLFGLPTPVTQYEVLDADGAFVARLDMAWPEGRIGREYDSVRYHGPDRIEADELRLQRLEALGWSMAPLYRYQLLPDEIGWLHELRDELGRSVRRAS